MEFSQKYIPALMFFVLVVTGCEQRIDVPDDAGGSGTLNDTNYVEISPPWGPFANPSAIMIGNDQLIYLADYDSNKIYMLDAGGNILKSRHIPHPVSIAQNSKMDLYVGGETIAPNNRDTIGAIYRISLVRWDTLYQSGIHIDTLTGDTTKIFRDTSYFYSHDLANAHLRVVYKEPGRPQRRFSGIGILPGNGYLVARVGPDNNSSIDPDCRVVQFDDNDKYITPIGILYPYSQGGTIDQLTGLMVFPSTSDFIFTQRTNSGGVSYGAIWMLYQKNVDFEGWLPKFNPQTDYQRGIDIVRSFLFRSAGGIAYDRRRREIFIVDSELDSMFKFDRNGYLKVESFGKYKAGLHRPSGIAYANDCTLYIADAGNNLVRRFRLSTQIQCN